MAAALFHEHRSAVPPAMWGEVLEVAAGVKPAGRATIRVTKVRPLLRALEGMGLFAVLYAPEPHEWGIARAIEGERQRLSQTSCRIYYAATASRVNGLLEAQRRGDGGAIGELLGYPPCCIRRDQLRLPDGESELGRLAREAQGRIDWRMNVFLTEWDRPGGSPFFLLSHFPCRLDCPASRSIARRHLESLRRLDPRLAQRIEDVLRLPLLVRDERHPPPERRLGLHGALLCGIDIDHHIFYSDWVSLRQSDPLEETGLVLGNVVRECGKVFVVGRYETGETLAELREGEWTLLRFS